ncbi:macrophage mannose receptor 1-like [Notothenia coriiceps]|uniref:Macrophage mannose receptor 1-like n=1 Tax=Notothenia coriiceps TaxID=8208 RepID=A0A6I9PF26_9TELE|nr:PREDICTED: macrophage mannose receptor 1-like [Notothenia coriiceps]
MITQTTDFGVRFKLNMMINSGAKEHWNKHITTGAYYQLNTQSALTWAQAEASCKQQASSLLSITDPHQQAYLTALLGLEGGGQGDKLWTGLIKNPEQGWHWSNGRAFRYLNWDSGHPLPNPGHDCGIVDPAVQYLWQSSTCTKKLGYICYSERAVTPPTTGTGFCSRPWIPYNGHCFHLNRAQKKWSDAQQVCRKEGGDLVSIRNVEDQSFVISQLGYASTDELWIGLNDKKTERLFDWIDHSAVTFTSWELGKPAVFSDAEDCVLIRGENGNWADRVCDEKHGFICMKMSASQPSGDEVEQDVGCKTGWKRHGSYCYFVGTETKTFDEAKNDCKTSDSYLADVSNGVDNAFLVSLVGLRPEKYFWLGLSNQNDIDQFVWTNANSVRFTHWNAEMPGHQQGCVAMTTGVFAGLWDVMPCTNKEKYICKHLAEGAVLTPAPPTQAPLKCADGWTPIGARNFCYKLFPEPSESKRTWYDARDYCRTIGGDLLSIHSGLELTFVKRASGTVWIGLSAPDPVTGYVWSDGSPVNFLHWHDGEPNNKNNVESCAEFRTYLRSGSWSDVNCAKNNQWLCQIRTGATPKPPPDPVIPDYNKTSDGWLEWNGTQYYINKKKMAMEKARRFCQQRHGDLVTIDSEAERVFLWNQISKSQGSYWIGLDVDLDGTYEWMDSSPVLYQSWNEGQPDFKYHDENCAIMGYSTGFWHNYNCGFEYDSICKRSGSPPANTTVAPTVAPKGGCPPHWKQLNHKCYSIIKDQKETWNGARKQCKDMGGNLASISSRHVEDPSFPDSPEPTTSSDYVKILNDSVKVVTQNMSWDAAKKHCEDDGARLVNLRNNWSQAYVEMLALNLKAPLWIGLNKNQTNGYFRYIDGWFLKFSHWGNNEPSRDRPCVYVDVDGKWKTADCKQIMNSVCMKSTGGSLASIEHPFEQDFIQSNTHIFKDSHSSFWIGLFKTHKGEWLWLDKTIMDYAYWDEDQPDDGSHGGISTSDGTWKTSNQGFRRPYICKTPQEIV